VGPLGHSLAAASAAGAVPLGLLGLALRPAWRVGIAERLGWHPAGRRGAPGPVWVHCASVGEVRAARSLLDALADGGSSLVASTVTTSGRDLLRALRPGVPCGLAPLDHPWTVQHALRRVAPSALVLVETELWPCWIYGASSRGIPVVVASARISDRSFPRYRRAGAVLRPLLGHLAAVGARSEADAERFVALGVPAERVQVTGDLKLEPSAEAATLPADLTALLGSTPLFVAGSTHPGEEEAALDALDRAEVGGHPLALVLAPRHLERAAAVAARVARRGREVRRRSQVGAPPLRAGEVLILDSLGELPAVYGRAQVAFVGGTLVPVGGHNLLEPVQQGVPSLFGPHTENARSAAALLLRSGAGHRVADALALARAVEEALADPVAWRARALAGQKVLEAHRGAADRTVELLGQIGAIGAAC